MGRLNSDIKMFNPRLDKDDDYKFFIELYPDSDSNQSGGYDCNEVLENISRTFTQIAFILHDKDYKDDGTISKRHIHVYAANAKNKKYSRKSVAEKIGLSMQWIEYAESTRACIQYLIHNNNPEKYSYPISDIECNFDISKYLRNSEYEKDNEFLQAFIYLADSQEIKSFSDMVRWASQNGFAKQMRQSAFVISKFLKDC